MKSRTQIVAMALIILGAAGASTLIHGRLTDRWVPMSSETLDLFTQRVPRIPKQIGDWRGTDTDIGDKQFSATGCTAYISRFWTNQTTGDTVSMYVVSGTARHITIHSPDWCYQGAGYDMESRPSQFVMDCGELKPEWLTSSFKKEHPANPGVEQRLRIFWSYSDDGQWQGPNLAKMFYGGRPALYKIYLICDATSGSAAAEDSPALDFAKMVMPKINQILFEAGESGAKTAMDSDLL